MTVVNEETQNHPVRLAACGIDKYFPGVHALSKVDFDVRAGEVHALVGENGAGKSTLIKILSGAELASDGYILAGSERVEVGSPLEARHLGIAAFHQELSLVPHLSVAQNVFLGREPMLRLPGIVNHRRMREETAVLLQQLNLECDPSTEMATLPLASRQIVEVAKALSQNARVLILDEPTASLSDRETDALFEVIERLKADGVAIIYISHRMNEIWRLADRITILRDGRRVLTETLDAISQAEVIEAMIGRPLSADEKQANGRHKAGEVVLSVKDLSTPSGLDEVNIEVRRGEIVGLSGLVGSGRSELAKAVFGIDPIDSGTITLHGRPLTHGPDQRVRSGVALVPEDRKQEGLCLTQTVNQNLIHAAFWKLFPKGWYVYRRARESAIEAINRLGIATPSPDKVVGQLSGGNQQKIVLGKWLTAGADLIIVDEPTRGIDIGAKAEVMALLEKLVGEGNAVLMVSSELPEIVGVCDRVYVMRQGRIVDHLVGEDMTEAAILRSAIREETNDVPR